MTDHLIDHRYSVLEIERMRKALYEVMFPVVWMSATAGSRPGTGGRPGEVEAKVETQLRTYMLAGSRPEELEAIAQERLLASQKQRQSFQRD